MSPYVKVPDGIRYHPRYDRIMEHRGYATRIFWNTDKLDYLRRHFSTTLNDELAACLGVSHRTMIRKARELGLHKEPGWLLRVWESNRRLAHASNRLYGNSGMFRKGEHHSLSTEFKPQKATRI